MSEPSTATLVDCRWLGLGGAGRATELLLRGLSELAPPGDWALWGPAEVSSYCWAGAEWLPSRYSPTSLWGQREALAVPTHAFAIYMHQIRPLVGRRSVTLVHDTIPLEVGGALSRSAKRAYFRRVVGVSTGILTVSRYSAESIRDRLSVPLEKQAILRYPVDPGFVDRVHGLRREHEPRDALLYVGRFARHKNLSTLVNAFAKTSFAEAGGRLILLGGARAELESLIGRERDLGAVEIIESRGQAELEELFATCRALVLPSLVEGFGLPAWEAMMCGLPLCVSRAGALPELVDDRARFFDPGSVASMASAIDAVVRDTPRYESPRELAERLNVPGDPREFAAAFVAAAFGVGGLVAPNGGPGA